MDIMSCIPTNIYPMDAAIMAMQMSPRTDLCASGMTSDPLAPATAAPGAGLMQALVSQALVSSAKYAAKI